MRRERLYERLESRWNEFHDAIQGLPHDALMEAGVVGHWSVRDVLSHIATWEEEALKALPVILEGGRLPRYSDQYGGIDAFNAQAQERKQGLSLEEAFAGLDEPHRRLLAYLDEVPDSAFAKENRFLRRLRQDTYGHYWEHAKQIRSWREARRS